MSSAWASWFIRSRACLACGGVLAAVAGCVEVTSDGTSWQDIATITGALAPERGADPAPRAAPCALRIATWNVHFADDVTNLAGQIARSTELVSADVMFVQEIRHFPDEPASRAELLARALGMTWVYAPAHGVPGGTHGLAILSRYPLARAEVRELPYIDQAINPERRIALRAEVMLDGDTLPVVDVHLDTRLAPTDRIRQLDPAIHDVGERMIIGGDFNTLPWTWIAGAVPLTSTGAVVDQRQAIVLDDFMAYNHYVGVLGPDVETSRTPVFTIRLDNLYARAIPITAGAVEHVDGSDHWPVWFDVDRCQ